MANRSRIAFILGLAVFVGGCAAAFLALTRSPARPGADEASAVLYAAKPIPAGTTAATAVGQGLIGSRTVDPRTRPPTALIQISDLAGRMAGVSIGEGALITAESFPKASTRIGTLRIPAGKTALAVQLKSVPGVAGYAGAGDRVNVYAVAKTATAASTPGARLILQGVEVLRVNGTDFAPDPGKPVAQDLLFLIAVTPVEAERLVYLTSFEELYFSLVPLDQPPFPPTPGSGPADSLKVL